MLMWNQTEMQKLVPEPEQWGKETDRKKVCCNFQNELQFAE